MAFWQGYSATDYIFPMELIIQRCLSRNHTFYVMSIVYILGVLDLVGQRNGMVYGAHDRRIFTTDTDEEDCVRSLMLVSSILPSLNAVSHG